MVSEWRRNLKLFFRIQLLFNILEIPRQFNALDIELFFGFIRPTFELYNEMFWAAQIREWAFLFIYGLASAIVNIWQRSFKALIWLPSSLKKKSLRILLLSFFRFFSHVLRSFPFACLQLSCREYLQWVFELWCLHCEADSMIGMNLPRIFSNRYFDHIAKSVATFFDINNIGKINKKFNPPWDRPGNGSLSQIVYILKLDKISLILFLVTEKRCERLLDSFDLLRGIHHGV